MKTTKKSITLVFALLLATLYAAAQNYKAPKIDASGKVTDVHGKHIGNIDTSGTITDAHGTKIAYVDAEGFVIDASTGKKIGKGEKNGNFTPYYKETPDKGWATDAPLNGMCLVKDEKGNVKAVVHENYKQFGACAAHCLANHMDHHQVMTEKKKDDKKKEGVVYSCSMHPEVTSDKPGKCPKCGMELHAVNHKD